MLIFNRKRSGNIDDLIPLEIIASEISEDGQIITLTFDQDLKIRSDQSGRFSLLSGRSITGTFIDISDGAKLILFTDYPYYLGDSDDGLWYSGTGIRGIDNEFLFSFSNLELINSSTVRHNITVDTTLTTIDSTIPINN